MWNFAEVSLGAITSVYFCLGSPPTPPPSHPLSPFSSFLDLSLLSCLVATLPCGEREEEEDDDKKKLVAANLIFLVWALDNIYFITVITEYFCFLM